MMIQTEPLIYEPELTHEPNTLQMPVLAEFNLMDDVIPMAPAEELYALELP